MPRLSLRPRPRPVTCVTFHFVDERMPPQGARDVRTLRDQTAARLAAAGVPDPEVDADLLIGHVLGLSRGGVQARAVMGGALDDDEAAALEALVVRRAAREPLQHLTGRAAFRSLELAVGPGVFVPRPETEQVVQLAIDALRATAEPEPIAVDLGTGSGAIALSMATEVPHARVWAVENSPDAYHVDAAECRRGRRRQPRTRLRRPRDGAGRARRPGRGRDLEPALRARGRDPASTPRCTCTIRSPRSTAARTASTSSACSPGARPSCCTPGGLARDRARRTAVGGDRRDPLGRRMARHRASPRPHAARPGDDRDPLRRGIRPGLTWPGRVVPARVQPAPVRARPAPARGGLGPPVRVGPARRPASRGRGPA